MAYRIQKSSRNAESIMYDKNIYRFQQCLNRKPGIRERGCAHSYSCIPTWFQFSPLHLLSRMAHTVRSAYRKRHISGATYIASTFSPQFPPTQDHALNLRVSTNRVSQRKVLFESPAMRVFRDDRVAKKREVGGAKKDGGNWEGWKSRTESQARWCFGERRVMDGLLRRDLPLKVLLQEAF